MLKALNDAAVRLLAKTKLPNSRERDEMARNLSREYLTDNRELYTRLVIEEVIDDLKKRVDRERE